MKKYIFALVALLSAGIALAYYSYIKNSENTNTQSHTVIDKIDEIRLIDNEVNLLLFKLRTNIHRNNDEISRASDEQRSLFNKLVSNELAPAIRENQRVKNAVESYNHFLLALIQALMNTYCLLKVMKNLKLTFLTALVN